MFVEDKEAMKIVYLLSTISSVRRNYCKDSLWKLFHTIYVGVVEVECFNKVPWLCIIVTGFLQEACTNCDQFRHGAYI